jgi:aspartate kinase
MGIVVRKYGGSSLATIGDVHRVARCTADAHRSGQSLVVVVSARGNTTDALLRLAGEVSGVVMSERGAREVDQLLSTGECASAALLALALQRLGVPAVSLTGPQAGIRVTGTYGSGVITAVDTGRIRGSLTAGGPIIVTGFQGLNARGDMVTLGRGGSDTTAVALAAALRSRECGIYTDVMGVCSADPRLVPTARVLPRVDVRVMAEMAFAGAGVVYSRAVELAAMRNIELRVLHATAPGDGTVISGRSDRPLLESDGAVIAIAHDFDVARVLVYSPGGHADLAAEVLAALGRNSAPVDMVARSGPHEEEFRMGFTIRRSDLEKVQLELQEMAARSGGGVRVDEDLAKVSVIGMGLLNRPGYASRMISTLSKAGIVTSWISTSQLRASAVVPRRQVIDAVEVLHREFGLEQDGGHESPAISGDGMGARQ